MPERTVLSATHRAAGAKLVDFAGWEMPLDYGSQIEEHHAVRRGAGMFDVSHMRAVEILGAGARDFLRHALANDVARLDAPGRALYSCMLNERGGVVDDLIAYFVADDAYRLVVNAGTADKDIAWLGELARRRPFDVADRSAPRSRADRGPGAGRALDSPGPRSRASRRRPRGCGGSRARSSATGSSRAPATPARTGSSSMLPAPLVERTWQRLAAAGVRPCGLGARDTLRLEAGMALYGHEMDETTSPLEAGLAWTVDTKADRDFVGRAALGAPTRSLVGLVALDQGVLRAQQAVRTAHGDGVTTSGSFAPTLNRSIALARVPAAVSAGDTVEVEVRGKGLRARLVTPPFVRDGRSLIDQYLIDRFPS